MEKPLSSTAKVLEPVREETYAGDTHDNNVRREGKQVHGYRPHRPVPIRVIQHLSTVQRQIKTEIR